MIYFIQELPDGNIKIGSSSDPERRLLALQTSNSRALRIVGTMPGDTWFEFGLHKMFSRHHVRNEWFKPHAALVSYIRREAALLFEDFGKKPPRWPLRYTLRCHSCRRLMDPADPHGPDNHPRPVETVVPA